MDKKEFGKYIAKTRKAQNLTQKDLADLLNVSVSAVSKWEQGHSFPDLGLFHSIANALGISFSELISQLQSTETGKAPQTDPPLPVPEGNTPAQPASASEDPEIITSGQQLTVKKKRWLKPALLCSLAVVLITACFTFIAYTSMQKVSFTTLNTEVVYEKMYDPTETEVFTIYIQIHGKYSYEDIEKHTHEIHEAWENGSAKFETDASTICLKYYDTANYEGTKEICRSYLLRGI